MLIVMCLITSVRLNLQVGETNTMFVGLQSLTSALFDVVLEWDFQSLNYISNVSAYYWTYSLSECEIYPDSSGVL